MRWLGINSQGPAIPSARALLRSVYLGRMCLAVAMYVTIAFKIRVAAPLDILVTSLLLVSAAVVTLASYWHTHFRRKLPGPTFLYLQAVFDVLLITAVVHMTGGAESDLAGLYVLLIAISAVLMPPASAGLVTLFAGLVYFSARVSITALWITMLPLPTRIVIGASQLLTNFWWAILGALGFAIFSVNRYYKTSPGKLQIDKLLLSLPVLGDLLRKSAVSRFTRTLGTLISSGVSILDGLEITARTAGNMVIHNAVMESRASIAGGETIAAPLQKSKVFPPMVISMIAVGEQTGGLDEMLTKIADFYDDEVDAAVSALLSLLEPIMIVVLGVIVGGMVVAMYLPIFDMVNAVQ